MSTPSPFADASTAPPVASGSTMDTLYRAALGPVQLPRYLALFERFDQTGRAPAGWNLAASLATLNWMLLHHLWTAALIYVALVEGLALLIFGVGRPLLHWPEQVEWGLIAAFALFAIALPGLFGDALLHSAVRKRIAHALVAAHTIPETCTLLARQASSWRRLTWIAAANVLLFSALALAWVLVPPDGWSAAQTASTPIATGAVQTAPPLPAPTPHPAVEPAPPLTSAASTESPESTPEAPLSPPAPEPEPLPVPARPSTVPDIAAAPQPAPAASASQTPTPTSTAQTASTPAPSNIEPPSAKAPAPPAAAPVPRKPAKQATAKPAPPTPDPDAAPATAKAAPPSAASTEVAPSSPASEAAAPASQAAGSRPAAPVGSARGYYLNVGFFADEANARRTQAKLLNGNLPAFRQTITTPNGERTRVRVGPFETEAEAQKAATQIRSSLKLDTLMYRQGG